jgi:hypothetical protein
MRSRSLRARSIACAAAAVAAGCGDNVGGRVAGDAGGRLAAVLFVRGGSGTAGFVEGGTDDHLSDITDTTTAAFNRGYGELAALLRGAGYSVDQITEGPASDPGPVDLAAADLDRYAVVVFGSNNASYGGAAAGLVVEYVARGGGALFVSDGNWGSFWDKAPSSDQTFLTPFGLIMNQDGGGRTRLGAADFVEPEHPILAGVEAFEGEGTSPCTLSHDRHELAIPRRLVAVREVVHRNTAPDGPVTPPTDDDAALAIAELGAGRVACHFDRNTFFNPNGAGTSLAVASNAIYARNLFDWLAQRR